jgi:hypothetical protein
VENAINIEIYPANTFSGYAIFILSKLSPMAKQMYKDGPSGNRQYTADDMAAQQAPKHANIRSYPRRTILPPGLTCTHAYPSVIQLELAILPDIGITCFMQKPFNYLVYRQLSDQVLEYYHKHITA